MRRLYLPVDGLLLRRQLVEIQFGCRRQRLDDVLQRILVNAVPQIEQLDRDFGVGQELLADISLPQIFADGIVVCKIAVVDQRFVHAHKRMRSARMPHTPLGGIALMGNPRMRLKILELVILDILLGIADQFENQEISSVGEDEGALVAERGVVVVVEPVGIPPDEFILEIAGTKGLRAPLRGEGFQDIGLCAHHIPVHIRRTHLEPGNIAIVVNMRLPRRQDHFKVRQDVLALEFGVTGRIQQRDLKEIISIQHFARNAHLLGSQADSGDAASFAVSAVLHLNGRFVDEPPGQRHGAGKTGNAAAAFFRGFRDGERFRP